MTDGETFLRCHVAQHDVALPAADVITVHRAVAIDPLPGAPETIAGVVDLHGELVPVLSLRRRFGLPPKPVAPSDALVLVAVPDRRLLLLVDGVRTIESVPAEQVRDAAEVLPGGRYLRAVAGTPAGPVAVSDLAAFLSSDEAVDLDAALAALDDVAAPA